MGADTRTRADHLPAVGDGHGHEQKFLVERVAAALADVDVPASAEWNSGRSVVGERLPGGRASPCYRPGRAPLVDDHRARTVSDGRVRDHVGELVAGLDPDEVGDASESTAALATTSDSSSEVARRSTLRASRTASAITTAASR